MFPNVVQPLPVSAATSVLSPHTWPFSLDWLPQTAYLVGGNVRDALLGRQAEYLDLDFVLPDSTVAVAKGIANHYQAGFVLLDAERQIARVVFERATVDFAQQVGGSLAKDLYHRDFTVNAIAYNPHTQELLDPLQGYADLQRRLIRMVAIENLKEDPLRLLRAYRQAAQLGFQIDPQTRTAIQQLAGLLQTVAAERVQAELSYLLSTATGTQFLQLAWEDGLLKTWLPQTTAQALAQATRIDPSAKQLTSLQTGLDLSGWLRDQPRMSGTGRSWLKVAKLACLLANDPATAEAALWNLKYSRVEIQAVLAVIAALPKLETLALSGARAETTEQYQLFRQVGTAFPALAVLGVAVGVPLLTVDGLVKRYLTPTDPVAHPTPLVTGRDLMRQLGLPPSPVIGHILETLQLAHAEGKIDSAQTALAYARTLVSQT
ncbi:MAG: CCA tRNA nucleotidyltransferase [Elainella sp.]